MKRLLFFIVSVFVFWCSFPLEALDVPALRARINDNAGMLSAATVDELEKKLQQFEEDTSNQIAVLIIPDLQGEVLEDYSIRITTSWKLGQKGKDNGVLLLISKNDHKLRIEVGYGLEATLTDALSHQIINQEIVPQFKNGDFDEGVSSGVNAIMHTIEGTYKPQEKPGDPFDTLIPIFIFGIFIIIQIFRIRRYGPLAIFGGGWSSGGSSSGGFSGGGGSFGGGGSSGSW